MTIKQKVFSATGLRPRAYNPDIPAEQVAPFRKGSTQKAVSTANAYAGDMQGLVQKDIRISKLEPPQNLLSKPRFVNMLMSSGEKNRAYELLLASINTCKYKMFEKRLLVHKQANTKTYNIAPSKREKNTVVDTQRSEHYYLHTDVQKAIDITQLPLPLQSRGMHKKHSKRILQSDQVCSKTAHHVEPIVETRKVRVRGSTYQVPSTVHSRRRERMAVCWVITNARTKRVSRKEALSRSLGQEFFDCINKRSTSIQKRDQMYRLAANSRVYIRYKWW